MLSKMVKTKCENVSITGKKTNHSLCATGITSMLQAGLLEKVIQDNSGHRSVNRLCKYERISEVQQASACKALSGSATGEVCSLSVQHNLQDLPYAQPTTTFLLFY